VLLMLLGLYLLPFSERVYAVDSFTVSLSENVFALFVPILYIALLLYGLPIAAWPREREIPFNCFAVGVVLHLLAQLVVLMHRNLSPSPYEPAKPWLLLCFCALLLLALLSLNRTSMLDAAQNRQRIPLQMRKKNVAFTLGFFLLVMLVSAIPQIIDAIERAWNTMLEALWRLIRWLVDLMPMQSASGGMGGEGGADMYGLIGAQEPSLLAIMLEKIAFVLAFIFGALLLFLALRTLLRGVVSLLHRLFARISGFWSAVSEDYEDEIINTREEGGAQSTGVLSRLRQSLTFVSEKRLSPAERIRYRYRRLLGRHPDWHESRTARENLRRDAASLYERARYSAHPVTEEDAEQFSSNIKNL